MTDSVECVVVGAGCVGLAVARALVLAGREVLLLEQHDMFGTETSSRNSEVIHAGIYYEPGSLKARLCVRGKALLYPYLRERGIDHKQCGKLIVATSPAEVPRLAFYQSRAVENGVHDLELLTMQEAQMREPLLSCEAALLSPSTGVFDSHTYMLSLLGDLENAGGMAVFNAPVMRIRVIDGGSELEIGGEEPSTIQARHLINCTGLHATAFARQMDGFPAEHIAETRYAKGRYFMISGKAPFARLIYPMPTNDSQGTHYTCDLGGQGRLGPDITWNVPLNDYAVEEEARFAFWQAATQYLPCLKEEDLHASYAGLRPKIGQPGQWMDFRIDGPEVHGVPGIVQLFGIESPGLTSSLAIGEYVSGLM
ncbi:NAD(P)/FAD-dependent oxidoreductase [Parvularcula sp. IMCC14364]|uniref:NAD(P)/FAD-dependent oxidoreductase n=1 Tax=Parvularcula sp. IMCC14364 TaxID=3067902 RepID=UPI00274138CE|nr:NAD(P)/FAD-dependent oxidoreductase [Parvularcula sp. IMCC14364]